MDLYSVNTKPFKRAFIITQLASIVSVLASFVIADSGLLFVPAIGFSRQITFPVLLIMFIITLVYNFRLRKRINTIGDIADFEARVLEYEKIYRYRLQWNLITCLILCVLFVLSGRFFFFYFSIFHVLLVIPYYPNTILFRRELKNEEVILY